MTGRASSASPSQLTFLLIWSDISHDLVWGDYKQLSHVNFVGHSLLEIINWNRIGDCNVKIEIELVGHQKCDR